jgi:hypothetical protein
MVRLGSGRLDANLAAGRQHRLLDRGDHRRRRRLPAAEPESALHDRARYRRYGIIVGIEFALAGIGAAALGIFGAAAYIPIWVCAVVGVHFFPLAPVLNDPGLRPVGAALVLVSVAALVINLTRGVAPSSVTGIGAGALLLGYSVMALIRAVRT